MANYREDFADVELQTGKICRNFMNQTIGSGDALGDRFGVHVFRDGEPVTLGGSCAGYFVRNATGETIVISSGVVSGNEAYVTLPAACYAVEGSFTLAIKVTSGDEVVTLRIVDGMVDRTNTSVIVDPGNLVPSIEDLIDAIDAAVASIPADYSSLWTSLAPAFSTSVNYTSGQYVTYNGALYRFTVDHPAGTWNSAHVAATNLGADVNSLKSAISDSQGNVIRSEDLKSATDFALLIDGKEKQSVQISDLIQGSMFPDYSDGSTSRVSLKIIVPVYIGMRIEFTAGTKINQFYGRKYDRDMNNFADITWGSASVSVDWDGFIILIFRNSASIDVVPSDYDAETNFISKACYKEPTNIKQQQLAFADFHSGNLFDKSDSNAALVGYWYYSATIGSTVSAVQNQYTSSYTAVKFKSYGAEEITISVYPNTDSKKLFWIGAVDADMKLLKYAQPNDVMPYTFSDIPSNTEYIVCSPILGSSYLDSLIAVMGDTISQYQGYYEPYFILEQCKTSEQENDNPAKIKAPDYYDLVVGDTFELFYKGIISAVNPELYDLQIVCNKGNAYAKKFMFTPTETGNVSMNLTLYDSKMNAIDSKNVTLKVKAVPASPTSSKNILCVGDSLTVFGQWVTEFNRRLTGNGGSPTGSNLSNIHFIGTCGTGVNLFEGYGGYTFNSYNTANVSNNAKVITASHDKTADADQHSVYKDSNNNQWKLETIQEGTIKIILVSGNANNFPSTGTLTWVSGGTHHTNIIYTASANAPANPFWDSTNNKVDFGKYATSLGVSSIDYVFVLLGWNDASTSEENYKNNAQTFIDNVKTSFPSAKIVLMGLEVPAKDGLAHNYGANSIYSNYYNMMQYVHTLDGWYDDIAGDNSNVYHINISGQFDTENNMPTSEMQVNTRNSTMEVFQSNGVHPANSGYLQIADAAYRCFVGLLSN